MLACDGPCCLISSILLSFVSLTSISVCLCCWWYFFRHSREEALHLDSFLALTYMNAAAGHSRQLTEQRVKGYDPLQSTTSCPWACLFPSCSLEDHSGRNKSSGMLWLCSPCYWQWKTTLGWSLGLLKLQSLKIRNYGFVLQILFSWTA